MDRIGERVKDPFLSDYLAIQRLVMEWVSHDKLIIAYDYDNTIYDYHDKGYEFNYVIDLLQRCDKIGAKFIVYSCSPESRHPEIHNHLDSIGLRADYINKPHVELADGTGKIFFNILLDDRAGLRSAYIILDKAADIMSENPKSEEEACELLKARFNINNCEF